MGFHLRGRLTTLRPASDADVDLLVRWHADPDVSRYWDDEIFTADEVRAGLRRERVDAFVVEENGEPVGYLQAWWENDEALRGGIDMFLIPAARGRGLGPDAALALVGHLIAEREWRSVTVDPYEWNDGAIRAWRKAGFVEVERRAPDDEHSAPWLLMEWRG